MLRCLEYFSYLLIGNIIAKEQKKLIFLNDFWKNFTRNKSLISLIFNDRNALVHLLTFEWESARIFPSVKFMPII